MNLLDNDYTLHIHHSGICRNPIKGIYREKNIYCIEIESNRKIGLLKELGGEI